MTVSCKEKVTGRNIASVIRFLPSMKDNGFRICNVRQCSVDDCDCLPQVLPTDEGISFIQTVEKNTASLQDSLRDWGVSAEARILLTSLSAIDQADEMQLMKLLALHVRADKYVRGHLQEAVNSGHILSILTRLETLLRSRRANGQTTG
jgi:hypothetical protein